jgi:ketosteroid isomerase-like protein
MDSKAKMGTGIPQVETPGIRVDEGRPRRSQWPGIALVLLVSGVIVAGLALISPSDEPTPAPEVDAAATQTAEETIDELLGAISSGDIDGAAALYAEDAIMVTTDGSSYPSVARGRDAIRNALASMVASGDVTFERTSDVIGRGQLAAYVEIYHGSGWEGMYGATSFLFDEEGMIAGQTTLFTSAG